MQTKMSQREGHTAQMPLTRTETATAKSVGAARMVLVTQTYIQPQ